MNILKPAIDMRSESGIRAFLANHKRYDTMGGCDQSTSFAHCVKIRHLSLGSDPRIQAFNLAHGADAADNSAYSLLEMDLWSEYGEDAVAEFTHEQGHQYTIGTNGRSGGYLVLYNSYLKASEYKSYCPCCGQRNFQAVPDLAATPLGNKCGLCGAVGERGRKNFAKQLMTLETRPGRSIGEDLEAMSFSQLKSLAKVVLAFDETCLQIRDNFIEMVIDCQVEEKVVMVPKTVKVLARRSDEEVHA